MGTDKEQALLALGRIEGIVVGNSGKLDQAIRDVDMMRSKIQTIIEQTVDDSFVPAWTPVMPILPPQPPEPQLTLAWWKMRNTEKGYDPASYRLEWFDGFFYIHLNLRGQTGSEEAVTAQRLQVREGKLWGRADRMSPWDIESTGWEYAGAVEFPE